MLRLGIYCRPPHNNNRDEMLPVSDLRVWTTEIENITLEPGNYTVKIEAEQFTGTFHISAENLCCLPAGDAMGPYMEFGIIEEFDKGKDYGEYEPEKYNCISVADDWLNLLYKPLLSMKTYFHCYDQPATSFARWGVTLIPPESLGQFIDVLISLKEFKESKELADLANLLWNAKNSNKYVIHFGV